MFTGMSCEGSNVDDVTLLVLDHARKERLDGPEVRQRVHVERLHDFGWKQKQKNYWIIMKTLKSFCYSDL